MVYGKRMKGKNKLLTQKIFTFCSFKAQEMSESNENERRPCISCGIMHLNLTSASLPYEQKEIVGEKPLLCFFFKDN